MVSRRLRPCKQILKTKDSEIRHLSLRRNRSCLSCYLDPSDWRHDVSLRNLNVTYEIGILTAEGKTINKSTGKWDLYSRKLGRLFNLKEIPALKGYTKGYAIKDKQFTIVVRLDFVEEESPHSSPVAMNDQFEKLFNNEKFSDFKVTSGDNGNIFVHKNILSIRSPVFATMMETAMVESEENEVTISDISSQALTEFLRFIYCGKVQEIDEIANELLYCANKYDVPDLKPICVRSLAKMLSKSNVLETMMLAELHGELELKKFCIDFAKWCVKYPLNDSDQLKAFLSLPQGTTKRFKTTMLGTTCRRFSTKAFSMPFCFPPKNRTFTLNQAFPLKTKLNRVREPVFQPKFNQVTPRNYLLYSFRCFNYFFCPTFTSLFCTCFPDTLQCSIVPLIFMMTNKRLRVKLVF